MYLSSSLRNLPTAELDGNSLQQVDIFVSEIDPAGRKKLKVDVPVLGYVAEGIVKVKVKGQPPQRIIAGGSFSLIEEESKFTLLNASSRVPAKVVTFYLR